MRRAALLAALALPLAACAPVVVPIDQGPANALAPEFAVLLENASGTDATVEIHFEAPTASGEASSTALPCSRTTMTFGELPGAYQLLINGEQVLEGVVPDGNFDGSFFVFEARIGPEGAAEASGPTILQRLPPPRPEAVAGCR